MPPVDPVRSESSPAVRLGRGNAVVEVELTVTDWRADHRLVRRMEADASDGQTDLLGEFVVEPDGKMGTEVASFESVERVFRVDLQGRNLLARYVRAERVPGPQESKPFERFNLRGFMVYGKNLYGSALPSATSE